MRVTRTSRLNNVARPRKLAWRAAAVASVLLVGVSCDDPRSPGEPGEWQAPELYAVSPLDLSQQMTPVRISAGTGNSYWVSDFSGRRIYRVRYKRNKIVTVRTFAIEGFPLGIAWAQNRLLVGNVTRGTVSAYSARGRWLYDLAPEGSVIDPTDIAVDVRARLVFVLDAQDRSVKVYRLRRRGLVRQISQIGLGDYDLQNPTGITIDRHRRRVYVSDYGELAGAGANAAIKIFDYRGNPVGRIAGKSGMLGARFSRPQGLALGPAGRLYLAEALAGEVQIYDLGTGDQIGTLGTFGDGPGELFLPLDIVLSRRGDVLVTNNRPGRIEVFPRGGTHP